MKRLLLSASALCALAALTAGPASAADLRVPAYRRAAVVCPTCNWTGFYVGFNLGESKDWTSTQETWNWNYFYPAGTAGLSLNGAEIGLTPLFGGAYNTGFGSTYRHASMGFIGGLQWGYNWQIGGLLLGLEGDWNWSSEKDTYTTGGSPVHGAVVSALPVITPSSQGWTSEEKIKWLTTWRARLGWAHDCFLWYVTGGVAWAKIETNYTLVSTPGSTAVLSTDSEGFVAGAVGTNVWGLPGGVAAANFSTTKTGWVVGGGVETAIGALFGWGNNWSMKLEYLYVDLGTVTNTIGTNLTPLAVAVASGTRFVPGTATGTTTFYSSNHVYEQIIRVGINYRFSLPTGQVYTAKPLLNGPIL
jgi:outer membrane immunogenic protein